MIFNKLNSFKNPLIIFYFSKLFILFIFIFNLFGKIIGEKNLQNNKNEILENLDVLELPVRLFPEPSCIHQVKLHSEQGPLLKRFCIIKI